MNMQIANLISILPYIMVPLILCVACGDKSGGPPDGPGDPEKSIVWVDTADVVAGDKAQIDVHAVVNTPTQGVALPLRLTGTGFAVDSVSFVGTLLEAGPLLDRLNIDDSHAEIIFIDMFRTYTPTDYIEPDSGLLMSIFIAVAVSAEAQAIEIDTVTIEGNTFLFVDTTFVSVGSVPFFTPGLINVAPTPSGTRKH